MPVLYGVFLHMGVAALNSIQVSGTAQSMHLDCIGILVGLREEALCSIPAHSVQYSSMP